MTNNEVREKLASDPNSPYSGLDLSGEIEIDGLDVKDIRLDSLRAQIAIVLQHNLVFNDTVANNIGCGDKGYTLPQIIDAAKLAP